ncbi:galectin-8 isoform X1 [Catharus ustulatus]|uniref:galectin-8-like isoform X1 n=1 Tax=Catharus ustulatus TaxID=91951 RepID=UPI00140CD5BC|nr:galectin-8-like isoform X1 [Catharus ustulatus]XP_032911327.1 galectin-8 isoform X1 [Catharus ustulatus]
MTSLGAPQNEMHKLTLDTLQKEISELSLDTSQRKISNPIIPYVGTIHGGLVPGEQIVIHGSVPDDADRFQVDLQCGSSIKPRADVAFHFNPRFRRSGCIVCNTLEREKWGWEEITYEMPFEKGESFKIVIMILKDKFQVSVNKKHLLLYNHRISLEKIDTLGIYGKVKIKTIEFISQSLQGSQPSSLGVTKISTENGEMPNGSQLSVPYVEKLDTALYRGCTIAIKGEVKKNPKSFAINLRPSGSKDIALHLNPRMKNKVFVRNSYLHDSWGEEEKEVASFPFSPGMYFELIIFCDDYQFKVAINGVHTLEYKYRFKQLEKINMLEVTGDVHLLEVRSW